MIWDWRGRHGGAGKIGCLTLMRAIVIALVSTAAYVGAILLAAKESRLPVAEAKPDEQPETREPALQGTLLA